MGQKWSEMAVATESFARRRSALSSVEERPVSLTTVMALVGGGIVVMVRCVGLLTGIVSGIGVGFGGVSMGIGADVGGVVGAGIGVVGRSNGAGGKMVVALGSGSRTL